MTQLSEQLSNIINKTNKLIDLWLLLKEENKLLELKNQELQKAYQNYKAKNEELEEKISILKLTSSLERLPFNQINNLGGKEDIKLDIKQKISKFVNEIDKCIAFLKKQYY